VTTTTQEAISDIVYRNFIGTCRTPSTRYIYKKGLEYFLSYLRLGPADYVKLLDMDTKIAHDMEAAARLKEYERISALARKKSKEAVNVDNNSS
jgi:hypothetical protein